MRILKFFFQLQGFIACSFQPERYIVCSTEIFAKYLYSTSLSATPRSYPARYCRAQFTRAKEAMTTYTTITNAKR